MLLLCIKIFFVRILDVSLGTVRTIVTVKGQNFVAALIGFVEVFVWFVIVQEALTTDSRSLWVAVSYAGGFATGTYIGGFLSGKLIKGNFGIQVVTSNNSMKLVDTLRQEGFAVSVIDVKGQTEGQKHMLFLEIDKFRFNHVKRVVHAIDPKAFLVVNETKYVQNGYFTK